MKCRVTGFASVSNIYAHHDSFNGCTRMHTYTRTHQHADAFIRFIGINSNTVSQSNQFEHGILIKIVQLLFHFEKHAVVKQFPYIESN